MAMQFKASTRLLLAVAVFAAFDLFLTENNDTRGIYEMNTPTTGKGLSEIGVCLETHAGVNITDNIRGPWPRPGVLKTLQKTSVGQFCFDGKPGGRLGHLYPERGGGGLIQCTAGLY